MTPSIPLTRRGFLAAMSLAAAPVSAANYPVDTLYLIPNMHGDSLGWLAPYYVERNFGLYAYMDHQDLATKDPSYKYVFSEIPHLITLMEYEPQKFQEFKRLLKRGQAELPNAFATEASVSLSGGEALVMQIVEGLRWYKQVMDVSPRYAYCIDLTGWHEQMAQIVAGTELESFIYCRYNPTIDKVNPKDPEMFRGGDPVHWIESPDGTRALAVSTGHYTGGLRGPMGAQGPMPADQLKKQIESDIAAARDKFKRFPKGTPMMMFAGRADYSLTFDYKGYPKEMLAAWDATSPDTRIKLATVSDWFDAIKPGINSGKYPLQTVKTGSKAYGFNSFWVLAPKMKQWFRRSEHGCQAAEALAAIASLKGKLTYPSQDLGNAWFLLSLNLDRGPLWGICVSGVYEHPRSWDIRDRYEMIDGIARSTTANALPALLGKGRDSLGLFNPVSWERHDPIEMALPDGTVVKDTPTQLLEDGKTSIIRAKLPSFGVRSLRLEPGIAPASAMKNLPAVIENDYYQAKVDASTGALISLKVKPSGREVLAGPANVVSAQFHIQEVKPQKPQRHEGWAAHFLLDRSKRVTVLNSNERGQTMVVRGGPLATIVETNCLFHGGDLRRVMRFYKDSPRIDFITETEGLPHETIVLTDFPLAGEVARMRRAIPYGFSQCDWASLKPEDRGNHTGVVPVIRWSHYSLSNGSGVALLDRGVPARELVNSTASIVLHLAVERYYWDPHTDWMSGRPRQAFQYALIAHDSPWDQARIPHLAWEYNAPALSAGEVGANAGESFVETSDNLIVEALRRTGDEIEMRMAECYGAAGAAMVKLRLPHRGAALTNMLGHQPKPLAAHSAAGEVTEYRFDVRPQQIVTLRLKTAGAVPGTKSVTTFDPLIPEAKRAFTRSYKHPEFKGYPPREKSEMWKWQTPQG